MGLVLMVSGLIAILFGFILILKDKSSNKWIQTNGVIVASNYSTKSENYSDGGGRYKTFMTTCKYEYSLKNSDETLLGTKILSVGGNSWTTSGEEQLNIFRKLHQGAKINVYYNPVRKTEACLITGKNYNLKLIVFIGLFLFLLGLGIYAQNNFKNEQINLNKIEIIK